MPVEKVKWQKIWKLGLMGLGIALVLLTGLGIYQQHKPLPQGISQRFPLHNSNQIEFLADYTYSTPTGERKTKQSIFNQVLSLIQQAQKTIILDMFLFNDYQGDSPEKTRAISGELAEALIAQKQKFKALDILVISDPINSLYGGLNASLFQKLSAAGIQVITTDLRPLRDSNPSWSVFWRLGIQWFGNNTEAGWLPSPVGPGLVTLRSYFALLNFKANHRKTLVVDQGKTWTGLVTSANPHDGSSAHGNVALRFNGPAVRDLIESEYAVARLSGANPPIQLPEIPSGNEDNQALMQIITEGAIRDTLLEKINATQAGDRIQIAIFYFSHRPLIRALLSAQNRGVQIQILLDPNKDAFGHQKNGIPNRQVAWELHQAGLQIRWCDTHGEQCHSKMSLITSPNKPAQLILGSANYTRRNLDNFNLETSVLLEAPINHPAIKAAQAFYQLRWQNQEQYHFSVDYSHYADTSWIKYWQYRLMEWSGWSTF